MISVNERKKLCAMQFAEGLLALIIGIAIAVLGEDALEIILIAVGVILVISDITELTRMRDAVIAMEKIRRLNESLSLLV